VATGGKHDSAAADPAPATSTTLATAPASAAASPSATATSASPEATTPSPRATSAGPSGTPSTATTPSATPSATATTAPAGPPKHGGGSAGGPRHVSSVAVEGFKCTADGHAATATVQVRYDGSAGSLRAVWWRSATGTPQGSTDIVSPQTSPFPKGAKSFTYSGKVSAITPDPAHPYIGVTVSTTPAAAAGNNSFAVVCR
jgi:hypothetical protein